MLMNTHKDLAVDFLVNIDGEKSCLVKENHFIWGNIKPDCASKYKLKKHYMDESFEMIVRKIHFLSSLTLEELYTTYSINKFSQELGVICHFLCDYFCVPHHNRWEFKTAMKDHVIYEKNLAKVAKGYIVKKDFDVNENIRNIERFIMTMQKEYSKKMDYKNDLDYASLVCQRVIDMILSQVLINETIRKNMRLVV